MSQLRSGARQLEFKIRQFRGVNENADGDANLANGEAAVMRNYRITDGGALKVRPGYVKAIPDFAPSASIHEGFEKQATAVYENGQEIEFFESAAVNDGEVTLLASIGELDMRSAAARNTLTSYAEAYFEIGGVKYKYTKATTATGISGRAVCYVFGKELTVDKGIVGLWSGMVAGNEVMLFARDNKLYSQQFDADGAPTVTAEVGTIDTSSHVEIFFFGDKVYVLDGSKYYAWDGSNFGEVIGYAPVIVTAANPSGGDGTLLEALNRLGTPQRCRIRFSANGTATTFNCNWINQDDKFVYVESVYVNGIEQIKNTDFTVDLLGNVTFTTAPASGSSNVEITYQLGAGFRTSTTLTASKPSGMDFAFGNSDGVEYSSSRVYVRRSGDVIELVENADYIVSKQDGKFKVSIIAALLSGDYIQPEVYYKRDKITTMRYAELFNGAADTRVFFYGDGTNKAYYSGVMENGKGSAEYFPDLNEMQVGDANTPITAMIRHHNRLLAFKRGGGAYSIYYGQLSLADGSITAGFYISNINKIIGCDGYDAATLVMNNPRTLEKGSIYEWQATSRSGNITLDQRNAEVVSEKVHDTLRTFDMENALTYYDVRRHEYYCVYNGVAVVNNTIAKAWYIYTNFPATCMAEYGRQLYFGTADGLICRVSEQTDTDDGETIEAYWESGSLDFGRPNDVKYTPKVWVSALPETNAKVSVGIDTDNGASADVELAFTPRCVMAKTLKANLKARKFTYYKLKMTAADSGKHATVLSAVVKASYDTPVKR